MEQPTSSDFAPNEKNVIARIINNLSFVAGQLLVLNLSDLNRHARANLKTIQTEFESLLKRLDQFATQTNDVRVGRLLEDLEQPAHDAAALMSLVRQCLLGSTFLSHCLVVGAPVAVCAAVWTDSDPVRVLH
jgi:hypothetical protein